MAETPALSFGALLRQLRIDADLSTGATSEFGGPKYSVDQRSGTWRHGGGTEQDGRTAGQRAGPEGIREGRVQGGGPGPRSGAGK